MVAEQLSSLYGIFAVGFITSMIDCLHRVGEIKKLGTGN